jgi:uncharacterized protein YbjT (DUF2867 family)
MIKNQVILFGATGLIGSQVLKFLLNDSYFKNVIAITRKPVLIKHKKLKVRHINFSNLKEIEECIKDSLVVFSTIGTTQSKVKGDKKSYREIDFDITYNIGRACQAHYIEKFLFISSSGADSSSSNFYLKLKGEAEEAVSKLNLKSLIILRPSLLLGSRNEFRFGEKIAQIVMPLFSAFLPSRFKPISSASVSEVMISLSKLKTSGNKIVQNEEILTMSKANK